MAEPNFIVNIHVDGAPPKGPDYGDGGDNIFTNFGRWARQNAAFTGGVSPRDQTFSEQQVHNRTQTYVITIPMSYPTEQPEGPPTTQEGVPLETPEQFAEEQSLIAGGHLEEAAGLQNELAGPAILSEAKAQNEAIGPELLREAQTEAPANTLANEQELALVTPAIQSRLAAEQPVFAEILKEVAPVLQSVLANPGKKVEIPPGLEEKIQGQEQGLSGGEAKGIQAPVQAGQESQFPPAANLIWFAALAHGGEYNLSFWQAYHDYGLFPGGGYNFGYEEIIKNCPTGAAVGMDIYSAFYYPSFGAQSDPILKIGPGSYSQPAVAGPLGNIINLDLTKNNQAAIPTDEQPDDYKPRRDGLGPVIFPTKQATVCVAVITTPAMNGTGIVTPPNWMTIDQHMQGTILGSLYIGMIPAGVKQLTFILPAGPGGGTIALMALPQARYSVPYQISVTRFGKLPTSGPFPLFAVKLGIAPSVPSQYPATSDTGYVVYAKPFIPPLGPMARSVSHAIDMGVGKKGKPTFQASIDSWRENLKNCCG